MVSYASWQSYQYFTRLIPHAVASPNTSCTDLVATLDGSLVALLDLRASQINGCLLCVQHHLCHARKAGVTAVILAVEIIHVAFALHIASAARPTASRYATYEVAQTIGRTEGAPAALVSPAKAQPRDEHPRYVASRETHLRLL
jgi:AhpD family alkylhydroperoxidase